MAYNPWSLPKAVEREYEAALKKVAAAATKVTQKFTQPDGSLKPGYERAMAEYERAVRQWAPQPAARMIARVSKHNLRAWEATSKSISYNLRRDEMVPTFLRLQAEQVHYITSIPRDQAERAQKLAYQAATGGRRAGEIEAEIARTGQVSASRAKLIARTEVAKTNSVITEARAKSAGSDKYIWRTMEDEAVRESHEHMDGVEVEWSKPPTLSDGTVTHAGQIYNCRCFAEPLFSDETKLAPPPVTRVKPKPVAPPPKVVAPPKIVAPPPPPVAPTRRTIQDRLVPGYQAYAWHKDSWPDYTPSWMDNAVVAYQDIRLTSVDKDGAYASGGRMINMPSEYVKGTHKGRSTFRHEYGHIVDYRSNRSGYDPSSSRPDFRKAADSDKRLINAAHRKTANNVPAVEFMSLEDVSSAVGVTAKEVREFGARQIPNFNTGPGFSDEAIRKALYSVSQRDPHGFLLHLLGEENYARDMPRMLAVRKTMFDSFTDLFGSLTRNKVLGYPAFSGHDNKYYAERAKNKPYVETFANLFDIASGDPTLWKLVKHMLPKVAEAFEKVVANAK